MFKTLISAKLEVLTGSIAGAFAAAALNQLNNNLLKSGVGMLSLVLAFATLMFGKTFPGYRVLATAFLVAGLLSMLPPISKEGKAHDFLGFLILTSPSGRTRISVDLLSVAEIALPALVASLVLR